MKLFPIIIIIFGIIIIYNPDIIAYLLGGLLIFIGINMFAFTSLFGFFTKKGNKGSDYVKFGNYKIYR